MSRQLQAENASIEEDQRQIEKYEQETKAMREEVHELKTKVSCDPLYLQTSRYYAGMRLTATFKSQPGDPKKQLCYLFGTELSLCYTFGTK